MTLRFRRAALAEIVRAVCNAVGGRHLQGGFLAREFLAGPADRRQLLLAAIAQADFFTWHEDNLSDRHAVDSGNPLSLLQDGAELWFVRVPIRLDPDDQHRSHR